MTFPLLKSSLNNTKSSWKQHPRDNTKWIACVKQEYNILHLIGNNLGRGCPHLVWTERIRQNSTIHLEKQVFDHPVIIFLIDVAAGPVPPERNSLTICRTMAHGFHPKEAKALSLNSVIPVAVSYGTLGAMCGFWPGRDSVVYRNVSIIS
uniref:Uncharacterized protein n=1 Tax=Cacopsylla melanoneura TaxID=428564 RepID=A0A8D9AHE5_9HEMI